MSFSQENLHIFHFKRYNVKNAILPYKYVFIWHLVFGNRSMAEFSKANPKWITTTNSGFAYLHTPIWYLYLETVASGLTPPSLYYIGAGGVRVRATRRLFAVQVVFMDSIEMQLGVAIYPEIIGSGVSFPRLQECAQLDCTL
jgi:hypothetical protein